MDSDENRAKRRQNFRAIQEEFSTPSPTPNIVGITFQQWTEIGDKIFALFEEYHLNIAQQVYIVAQLRTALLSDAHVHYHRTEEEPNG